MKRLFQIIAVLCLVYNATAQTYISMRPNWTFNPPQAENSTYEYYVSKGVGNTEKEARADAFVLAVKEAQTRVGVRANSEEIFRAFQTTDQDFNITANSYKIPMKEVCFFSEKSRDGQIYYYYQLLQVAISGNITPDFKQFTGDCYDFSKAKELREIMKEEYREQIEEDKKREEQKKTHQAMEAYKQYNISYSEFRFKINEFYDYPTTGYYLDKSDALINAGKWLTYLSVLGGIGVGLGLGFGLSSDYFPGMTCAITIPAVIAVCLPQIMCLSVGASYKKKAWKAYRKPYDDAMKELRKNEKHISMQLSPSVGTAWAGVGVRITF